MEMRELILSIKQKLGITVVFVTHDQQEAVMLADRIALMLEGRIMQYHEPQTFFSRPRTRRVEEFFGWTNFVPAIQKGDRVICSFLEFVFKGIGAHDGPICLTHQAGGGNALSPKGGLPGRGPTRGVHGDPHRL